jgi:pantothenate kinase
MPVILKGFDQALARLKNLEIKDRFTIGIVGKPGAGKSTLTSYLMEKLPKDYASLVPMDGYHLSNLQLKQLGLTNRKGAINTFDTNGFVNLLKRINTEIDKDIYFPIFHRDIEESYAAEGVVYANTRLVMTEGNYLLASEGGWEQVAPELDEVWYLKINDDLRLERLIKRHHQFGKDLIAAEAWARGTDEANARLIEKTANRADVVVEI